MTGTSNRQKEKPLMAATETIMQGADGEVKRDPPIEVYKSDLHGYWMVRWCGHEYATECPSWWGPKDVVTYLEHEMGEKVEVVE